MNRSRYNEQEGPGSSSEATGGRGQNYQRRPTNQSNNRNDRSRYNNNDSYNNRGYSHHPNNNYQNRNHSYNSNASVNDNTRQPPKELPPRFARLQNNSTNELSQPLPPPPPINNGREEMVKTNRPNDYHQHDRSRESYQVQDQLPRSFDNQMRLSQTNYNNSSNNSSRSNYYNSNSNNSNYDSRNAKDYNNTRNNYHQHNFQNGHNAGYRNNNNNVNNRNNSNNNFYRDNRSRNNNYNHNWKNNDDRDEKSESKSDESQREIMDDLLRKAKYECIVCCDMISISHKTWNCSNCYNVFHLKCIQMWAKKSSVNESTAAAANLNNQSQSNQQSTSSSSHLSGNNNNRRNNKNQSNDEWRCPTCQDIQNKYPFAYYCFCGKIKEPELNNYHVPHSCGETCSRPLSLFNLKSDNEINDFFPCPHKCTLMCHPGKCAPCTTKIERSCACSKTKTIMNCISRKEEIKCNEPCNKLLNCGRHQCQKRCHFGDCDPCEELFQVKCFCGKETRDEVSCAEKNAMFACEAKCGKMLSCGFHTCSVQCHAGNCAACPFDPQTIKSCPCAKTLISEMVNQKKRLLCIDPIPVCGKVCNKRLSCGSDSEPHFCVATCHSGSCAPCAKQTIMRCECGANSKKVDCKDIVENNFKCKRRCNKKLSCGRHKCLNECCTDKEHTCKQTCGRKLECGQHSCSEPCHSYCKPCQNVIWTEVYCNCGAQVLYPPLPCNTKRPPCDQPCARIHPCDHPSTHQCHDDAECPPCTEFVSKMCYGGHDIRTSIPCYQAGVSCGRFCMKPLPCLLHKCTKVCHEGQCPSCSQKCNKKRPDCDHPCGMACHQGTSPHCPETRCSELVKVYCLCELKVEDVECYRLNDATKFQSAMDDMLRRYNFNTSVNLEEIRQMVRYNMVHQLECDEKCAKEKRNKDLAEALGIDTTSHSSTIKYPDFLKNEARSNPQFIMNVHDKLVLLINNHRKTSTKSMCYNFPAMTRVQREVIHTYAEYFGIKTESVDREPNRNVMVTALKTSMIPEMSLLEAVNIDVQSLRPKQNVVKVKLSSEENKNKKVIDYFNFDGQD